MLIVGAVSALLALAAIVVIMSAMNRPQTAYSDPLAISARATMLAATPTTAFSTARPSATPLALAQEKLRYAAIGASDTVGVGTVDQDKDNWASQLAALLPPGTEFQRFARSGMTLGAALQSQIPAAIAYKPNVVTLWLVVNDALHGVAPTQYRSELKSALDELTKQTDATILLLNSPDLSSILQPNADEKAKLQLRGIAAGWNRVIAETAQGYGDRVVIVDLFTPSQATAEHRDWISGDNFHPSQLGYHALAEVVLAAMKSSGLVR